MPQMTRLSDDELDGIRRRIAEDRGCFQASDRFQLLAEVDRLREGVKLATDWLKLTQVIKPDLDVRRRFDAREAFRAWYEAAESFDR